MIKKIGLAVLAMVCFSELCTAQLTFSVSTGIGLNSAYVGYKKGKLLPFVALQGVKAAYSYEYIGHEYNGVTGKVEEYTNTYEIKGSLMVPSIGLKYLFLQERTVQTYITASITKPFAFTNDDDVNDALDELSVWGSEWGFGGEYFFDEHFSIAGEFGLRMLWGKLEFSYDEEVYNDNTMEYETKEFSYTDKLMVSPTYTKIALNFYF